MKGSDLLSYELKLHGVDWISTLSGNGLLTLYPSFTKAGIRLIDFRNEQGAAYAADTYAKLTGRVGVCIVSSGIAHCNALTGIANAYFDGTPVMLITGASPGYGEGKGVFQEFDQVALAAPICKYATVVNRVGELSFKVRQAFATAISGRPGPVHLTITQDVLDSQADEDTQPIKMNSHYIFGEATREQIDSIIKYLKNSKRPLLVAGSNLFYAGDPSPMLHFCEKACIPIVIPIWDRGVIKDPNPNFVGIIGAASGQPKILGEADLILMAGARVDYRVGFLRSPAIREDARIIRIDIDPNQIRQGVEPTVGILGDPARIFYQLYKEIEGFVQFPSEWLDKTKRRWLAFRSSMTGPPQEEGTMTGKNIIDVVFPLLTDEVIFLIDGGNIGQWVHMHADRYPSTWLTCGFSGVVGWGLPGAIGAKLAYPNHHVLLLSGDGAFGFTLGELESAMRQRFPFVAIVAVDEAWGLVVCEQLKLIGRKGVLASKFAKESIVRYDLVAKALGANGIRAETPEKLRSGIIKGFDDEKPTVIQVPIQIGGPIDRTIIS